MGSRDFTTGVLPLTQYVPHWYTTRASCPHLLSVSGQDLAVLPGGRPSRNKAHPPHIHPLIHLLLDHLAVPVQPTSYTGCQSLLLRCSRTATTCQRKTRTGQHLSAKEVALFPPVLSDGPFQTSLDWSRVLVQIVPCSHPTVSLRTAQEYSCVAGSVSLSGKQSWLAD